MQRGLGQRGSVLPLVAITLAVLMGFAGMGVDVGFLEYRQQTQQSATDAAAMGGAEEAYAQGCQSNSLAESAARADATLNGFTSSTGTVGSGTGTTVTPVADPSSGPYANNPCAVQVTINRANVQTFFTRIFGYNSMAETTQAVGLASQNNPGCIWLLSSTQQSDMANMTLSSAGCYIYINTSANMSNSTINASYIGYASGTNNTSGTTFTNATPVPMSPVSDPCPEMPGCAYLTANPPPVTATGLSTTISANNQTIGAANTTTVFDDLTISGQNETVCGLIEITGSQLHLNHSSITSCSSGATFAMSSNTSDLNFNSATLTIAAPSTGNTQGVVFWRNSAQGSAVDYSGCSCALTGLLYYPTAKVNYSTAADTYTVMVFGQGNFSNSGTSFSLGSPPPNATVALKPVLAQ